MATMSLQTSAMPFLRAIAGRNQSITGIDAGLLLGLYTPQLTAALEPERVVHQIEQFYRWVLSDDETLRGYAVKLNNRLDRLGFNYHVGKKSVARRMQGLEQELMQQTRIRFPSRLTERLHYDAGQVYQLAVAQGIDFYPLSVREAMLKAATIMNNLLVFDVRARSLQLDQETAFDAACGRYYTSLFRAAAKILLAPDHGLAEINLNTGGMA